MPTPDAADRIVDEITVVGQPSAPEGAPDAEAVLREIRALSEALGLDEAGRGRLLAQIQAVQLSGLPRVEIPEEFQTAVRGTDHTLLGEATPEGIWALCVEAAESNPYPNSVCVQGEFVDLARSFFRVLGVSEEDVTVCAVGARHFPRRTLNPVKPHLPGGYDREELPGLAQLDYKLLDVTEALHAGANPFDMVLNAELVLTGRREQAVAEIRALRGRMDSLGHRDIPLRVICSTGMLRAIGGASMVQRACAIVNEAAEGLANGLIVMKTETGFIGIPDDPKGKYAATVEDVVLMRGALSPNVAIKASGGVSETSANAMMIAGANFLGASGFLRGLLKRLKAAKSAPSAPEIAPSY